MKKIIMAIACIGFITAYYLYLQQAMNRHYINVEQCASEFRAGMPEWSEYQARLVCYQIKDNAY